MSSNGNNTGIRGRGKVVQWDGYGVRRYKFSNFNADVDIATPEMWRLKTSGVTKGATVEYNITPSVPGQLTVTELSAVTAAGTAVTIRSKDRNETLTPQLLCGYYAASGVGGTDIQNVQVPASGFKDKFDMNATKNYLFKFTAQADNSKVSMDADILQNL